MTSSLSVLVRRPLRGGPRGVTRITIQPEPDGGLPAMVELDAGSRWACELDGSGSYRARPIEPPAVVPDPIPEPPTAPAFTPPPEPEPAAAKASTPKKTAAARKTPSGKKTRVTATTAPATAAPKRRGRPPLPRDADGRIIRS